MRARAIVVAAAAMFAAILHGQSGQTVTPADYLRWRTELRNWGRWGPDDQKGTANLITPQKVQDAARLVRSGIVVGERALIIGAGPIGLGVALFASITGASVTVMDVDRSRLAAVSAIVDATTLEAAEGVMKAIAGLMLPCSRSSIP